MASNFLVCIAVYIPSNFKEIDMITLKTLPQATAQEVYDQVKAHLLSQKRQSGDNERCYYRSPNGLKCAAGILISDDEYRSEMEFKDWYLGVEKGIFPYTNHNGLIKKLQRVHDNYNDDGDGEFEVYIREQLDDIAKQFNLVP